MYAAGQGAVELQCSVQTYAWGKIGLNSAVAQLASNSQSFVVEDDKPYAEHVSHTVRQSKQLTLVYSDEGLVPETSLWMGTHPNGPSKVISKDSPETQSLSSWIESHEGCLGDKVKNYFGGRLPFLLKVLSVNKSLSIQAHPNKKLAELLHSERPDVYKDSNHKPEMAIALTDYEGLCGFRPIAEIKEYLINVPEFAAVVGDAGTLILNQASENESHFVLKECFTALMIKSEESIQKHLKALVFRINKLKEIGQDTTSCLGELVLRLNSQFPGDVGCFCAFFLNHVMLQPGEAMFLGPNLPHAYLSGDCVECMACSDNVVRAGLTPKYRDAETLCEMLDYKPSTVSDNIFNSYQDPIDPYSTIYDPPVEDFAVMKLQVPGGTLSYTVRSVDGPSILIVIKGSGVIESDMKLKGGSVLFLPANNTLLIENVQQDLTIFRAYCELK